MPDLKNLILASFSSVSPIFAAIESPNSFWVMTAIILPIFLFCVGKTVDVLVQIKLRRWEAERKVKEKEIASISNNSEEEKNEQI